MFISLIVYLIIIFCIISLGIVILRQAPVLARLSKEEIDVLSQGKSFIQKCREINPRQSHLGLMLRLEKFLRRARLKFLKMETLLGKWINGLRTKSQEMTQKSKKWIKQRELRKLKLKTQKPIIEDLAAEVKTENTEKKIEIKNEPEILSDNLKKEPIPEEKETEERKGPEARQIFQINPSATLIPISELKKPTQEEQKWIDLIVANPKNITAYKALGFIYWKQHNYADAKASLEAAVQLDSKDKRVLQILEELKEMERAKNAG